MNKVQTIAAPVPGDVRAAILARWLPEHPNVHARQVTMAYRALAGSAPGTARAEVIGVVSNPYFQALALMVDGEAHRPDGRPWHLTLSVADGVAPSRAQYFTFGDVTPALRPFGFPLHFSKRTASRITPETP